MKLIHRKLLCLVVSLLLTQNRVAYGHEEVVHRNITKAATASESGLNRFLRDIFDANINARDKNPKFGKYTAYGWLEFGSDAEDSDTKTDLLGLTPAESFAVEDKKSLL